MRKHAIRLVALLWLSGTFYVSFLLFSGRTSLNSINWNGGLDLDEFRLERVNIPTYLSLGTGSRRSTPDYHWDSFMGTKVSNSNIKSLPGQEWDKYLKYKNNGSRRLWPLVNDKEDRVLNQIHDIPLVDRSKPPKMIMMRWGMDGAASGRQQFLKSECPVDWCTLTSNTRDESRADLIFYKDDVDKVQRVNLMNPNQVSLLFILESPMHSPAQSIAVNWTATYRSDSVLNTPYEKFAFFKNFTQLPDIPSRNFAAGKTKKVAWFVSNCYAPNGRLNYALQLAKYIEVDIFGMCGKKECARETARCNEMLRKEYKFYLAFENSNCQDYITEKFFVNALSNDILPIVMGARPEDYKKLAPPNSYIHVDDFGSPRALAYYLHTLDQNDDLYNSYFRWKGTGELIDTKFWCRLCALLHERDRSDAKMWYSDIQRWWSGPGVCISLGEGEEKSWVSWRNYNGSRSDADDTFKVVKNEIRKQRRR